MIVLHPVIGSFLEVFKGKTPETLPFSARADLSRRREWEEIIRLALHGKPPQIVKAKTRNDQQDPARLKVLSDPKKLQRITNILKQQISNLDTEHLIYELVKNLLAIEDLTDTENHELTGHDLNAVRLNRLIHQKCPSVSGAINPDDIDTAITIRDLVRELNAARKGPPHESFKEVLAKAMSAIHREVIPGLKEIAVNLTQEMVNMLSEAGLMKAQVIKLLEPKPQFKASA